MLGFREVVLRRLANLTEVTTENNIILSQLLTERNRNAEAEIRSDEQLQLPLSTDNDVAAAEEWLTEPANSRTMVCAKLNVILIICLSC